MDWGNIITTAILSLIPTGGVLYWLTLRDKKRQESEKTAQAHEQTRQEKIESAIKEFEYLKERTVFAEENIPILHTQMQKQQEITNGLSQTVAELKNEIVDLKSDNLELKALLQKSDRLVCLDEDCSKRIPKLGEYHSKRCKKQKKDEPTDTKL